MARARKPVRRSSGAKKSLGGKISAKMSGRKRAGKSGGGSHGFKSKAQWRWAFANGYRWARKKAHKTAGGPKVRFRKLPWRKTMKKGKRRRL